MPSKLAPLEYPDRFEIRYVSANGGIRWWDVYFGPLRLGRLDERRMLIEDDYGRFRRHEV